MKERKLTKGSYKSTILLHSLLAETFLVRIGQGPFFLGDLDSHILSRHRDLEG